VTTTPVELLSQVLPKTFNAGIEQMRKAAQGGDAKAKYKLDALTAEKFGARFVLEGDKKKEVFLSVVNGTMTSGAKADAPVELAVALETEALEIGLEEIGDEIDDALPKIEKSLARFSVPKIKPVWDRLVKELLRAHFVIKNTPDFEEVRIKIAIGGDTPPEKPSFTVSVDYETFEKIRTGKVKPQAIMSSLQITGDSARVMQIAMELMQQRK
jgi:hypothetical protein